MDDPDEAFLGKIIIKNLIRKYENAWLKKKAPGNITRKHLPSKWKTPGMKKTHPPPTAIA